VSLPEWRLWIAKRDGDSGEPFDMWFYNADVIDFYSLLVFGFSKPGEPPSEEDRRWTWEIDYSAGRGNEMFYGEAASRSEAKRSCVDKILQYVLSIGVDDLLQGELPAQPDGENDELGWDCSIDERDDGELWYYGVTREEFYLTLELLIEGRSPDSVPELGAWKWAVLDENDTITRGTAPSRTAARQACAGALRDHLTAIRTTIERLRDLDFPLNECTDRERPRRCSHDSERLDS